MPRADFLKSGEFFRLLGALAFLLVIFIFINGWIVPDVPPRQTPPHQVIPGI